MSFLGLENLHAFVTGAAGGIGTQIVTELLNNGCRVTAHDCRANTRQAHPHLHAVQGDISDEASIRSSIANAKERFGPVNILVANAGITDESRDWPIWETPLEVWKKTYEVNVQGTFLTIKHFLLSAKSTQEETGSELENLAIVVTGSETGKFGQAGHTEYASGKAGLQYGLVRGVKNEIVRLNSRARINAVAPGWVNTALIGDRLDDPHELWSEAQATVALKKIAQPEDVARAIAFLASHRAAGHISGECLSVDGGMEGRIVWQESPIITKPALLSVPLHDSLQNTQSAARQPPSHREQKRKIKIALSVDVDCISGWLGTGFHPDNNLSDYSAGVFAGKVGVPRLVKLFTRLGVAKRMTWFIPGHSMETFPTEVQQVIDSGAEIALHGYTHEGAPQMTEEQQRDVFRKCIDLAMGLTGKKPKGWRAPLYQIKETTLAMLEQHGFEYDSSLSHHDSEPYWAPKNEAIQAPDFTKAASSWMRPESISGRSERLVEIPCNWYAEDATPLNYYPHTANSHGYVGASQMEQMWKDRFTWLWEHEREREDGDDLGFLVYPLVLHPDCSGMAHIIGMVERHVEWLQSFGDGVEFERCEDIAAAFKAESKGRR